MSLAGIPQARGAELDRRANFGRKSRGGMKRTPTAVAAADEDRAPLLGDEPSKSRRRRAIENWQRGRILPVVGLLAVFYLLDVQELVYAAFTSVSCDPPTVRAGVNVSCDVRTLALSRERGLTLTQLGFAGALVLERSAPHDYRVSFATNVSGRAGVLVEHGYFWTTSVVDVAPGPASPGHVEVACEPPRVAVGEQVRCKVVPCDEFWNPTEVEQTAAGHFTVARSGSAGELTVHDDHVSFAATAAGRAGVVVTLGGRSRQHEVEVT